MGNTRKFGNMFEFYQVSGDLDRAPIRDCLLHGYETKFDFYMALRKLVLRWRDRIGMCIEERHGFKRLKFFDTPGFSKDREWFPDYLLDHVPEPEYFKTHEETEEERITREVEEEMGLDFNDD